MKKFSAKKSADQIQLSQSDALAEIALELGTSLSLPDLVQTIALRLHSLFEFRAVAIGLSHGDVVESVIFQDSVLGSDRNLQSRLSSLFTNIAASLTESPISLEAADFLGCDLQTALNWHSVVIGRLMGSDGCFLGLILLADPKIDISPQTKDSALFRSFLRQASVAVENSRLFSQITHASRQWAEVFDSLIDFVVLHDDQHRVMRVNRSLADFISARPAELVGMHMRDLLSKGKSAGLQPCPLCSHNSDKDDFVYPLLDRVYLLSTSRVHGALQESSHTVHVMRDVTERREAEQRYHQLFDSVQEGVFFSSADGRFLEVNNALVKMLGYASKDELLAIDIASQLYVTAEERTLSHQKMRGLQGEVRNFEIAFRRKDGSLVQTMVNAKGVYDAEGRVLQYRGMILDITDIKKFQAQLQRERDFNAQILSNTQSMILVADTAGLISFANRRCTEIGGLSRPGLVGQKMTSLLQASCLGPWLAAFDIVLAGKPIDNLELEIERGDGPTGKYSVNMGPMRDAGGAVNSVVVVMTDVTENLMIQAKLINAEKLAAVGQLVSGVAHEVNNPLTAIMGFADLMLENPALPPAAHADLQVIMQEAERTKEIVQNLLSFARQTPPHRQSLDLNSVLRRTVALRSYDFASHGVSVVEHLCEHLPEIIGDAHQLQQVFLNILNNAYDAVQETGGRGLIEISSRAEGGFVEVAFRDNGPGIGNLERIFDPFFTTKVVGKGTGLGLSICYGILRQHQGEISAGNNANAAGATFRLRVPVAPIQTSAELASAAHGANA